MQIKLFLSVLVVLAFFDNAKAQTLKLKIESSNYKENNLIESIGYVESFESYDLLEQEIQSFKNTMYNLGYIELKVEKVSKLNSITSVQIKLGNKYELINLYANKEIFELIGITPKQTYDSLFYHKLKFDKVEVLMNKLTKALSNSGYPFASVSMDAIVPLGNNQLKANLKIVTKQARMINSIVIKGYDDFPKSFINYFLKIKKNDPFNLEEIQNKTKSLDQLVFAEQIRPAEVLFTKDSTNLYLNMSKNKSNRFDGFLGFGSKETSGGLEINGYLLLNLVNNLNYGESFILNYRNDENDLKTFDAKLTLPYLLKSPIGTELSLNIFKRDSTFTTNEQSVNLFYQLKSKHQVYLGYKYSKSNSLGSDQSSGISDYKTKAIELRYNYVDRTPQNLLFPIKSQIKIRLSRANRKTSLLNENQNNYSIRANHIFDINTSNSIYAGIESQGLLSKYYLKNELLRFGGIKTIRGFEENSINARAYGLINSEYRLILSQSLYIHSIIDAGYFETNTESLQKIFGIGFGFGLITRTGLLKFNIANGQTEGQTFKFSNSKVNLSLTADF
jgi:outer membrane protein assembly factor BamA